MNLSNKNLKNLNLSHSNEARLVLYETRSEFVYETKIEIGKSKLPAQKEFLFKLHIFCSIAIVFVPSSERAVNNLWFYIIRVMIE